MLLGVYISQLIRFARVCSNVSAFNNRNEFSWCVNLTGVFLHGGALR